MSCLSILIVLLYTYCEIIMSIKSSAMAITAAAALTLTTANCDSPLNKNKKQEIAEVLADSTANKSDWLQIQAQKADSIDLTKENSDTCFTVHMKDLEGWPLFWSKRMITPSYGNLLWFSQAEEIMKKYNSKKDKLFDANTVINADETIQIPLIYPELKSYFPKKWSDLAQKFPDYKNVVGNDLIIVTQCDNWKNALAYYKNWKLTLATYVSIGTRNRKTVTWEFDLKHDRIRRRSRRYHNSPMPYSMWITGGFYLHQWWSNWLPQSHGCTRVPGLYEWWLYNNLPTDGTKIILDGLYTPTLTKM